MAIKHDNDESTGNESSEIVSEVLGELEDQLEADRVADLVLHMQRQRELERRLRQQIQSLDRRFRESQRILRELVTQLGAVVTHLNETGSYQTEKLEEDARSLIQKYGLNPHYQAGLGIFLNQPGRKKSVFETNGNVDCEERIAVCHGRCCQFGFALSAEEVASGKIDWDPNWPFYIKRDKDGFCVHWDRKTGFCGIYEQRPEICRTYSCEKDKRMWEDFEGKIPGPYATGSQGAGKQPEDIGNDTFINEEGEKR
ncbi:MAG: YkgJ family cysteine cluster protein [bacterium]|nr:MAG: YkgJ family cysteine cluster protein [bacterium]